MGTEGLRSPEPVLVADLFAPEREALLELLAAVRHDEWQKPTICPGWSVKDIASHILGADIGKLSRSRDEFHQGTFGGQGDLVQYLNHINEQWIRATRRLSPRVLCDLLAFTAGKTVAYFRSVDLSALGEPVSWAGPQAAPVWLDVAREYTERWVHQQQIRDALGEPGLTSPRFLAPVLQTFVRALPHTFREVEAALGATVCLTILGQAGGNWTIVRQPDGWVLHQGATDFPNAHVSIDEDRAWRLFTKGISADHARVSTQIVGEPHLAAKVLQTVSIIA